MLTLSNSLSFVRAPLAFLFLQENTSLRLVAILLAMITDSIDGYVARRSRSVSRFGAFLDPAMDKFFVIFALSVLFMEDKVALWQIAAMLSRDFFQILFVVWTFLSRQWKSVIFRVARWGKIATAMQFVVLMGISLDHNFSWMIFLAFVVMGWLAFLEHFQTPRRTSVT